MNNMTGRLHDGFLCVQPLCWPSGTSYASQLYHM